MYSIVPSSVVRNGLIQGHKCPISGREFVAFEATKSVLAELYQQQQAFTRDVMAALDGGTPNPGRDPATYRGQFFALRSSQPERFREDGSFKTTKELRGDQ